MTEAAIPGLETFPPAERDTFPTPTGLSLGARLLADNRCEFRVWAPQWERVDVHILAPEERRVPMSKTEGGYYEAVVDD